MATHKLEFQLSERIKITVVPDRFVKAVKVSHSRPDGGIAVGMMTDKKDIAALIEALRLLI